MTNYGTYIDMPSVPAGAILDRIIHQQRRTKVDVASSAHLIPQRLNDLIRGNRRFTPKNSMDLEQTLNIGIDGFFYIIQAKHDIYNEQKNSRLSEKPNIGILSKTTFWDVDLDNVDWPKCADWAIRRALEYGTADEIREMARFYGADKVREVYSNPKNFRLYNVVQQNFKNSGL